ncbi:TetR/AcrR family transcriptional regulator [Umezawaea beigongshangensis]|uniref:TetR/AcrR family transcriptional regulator n=1 Tax=Umezawaea beigongshangensis TaxID=2780383 RepID=UPI0018F22597|nr:TetR/AcrR family transcriptional regulator [Umezawaea beigongshangensis]
MSRRRLSPERRRAELLDAAHRAFAGKPYHLVRLEDVAAEAGASTALIAFHFGGKRELYVQCLRAGVAELLARHDALPGPPGQEQLIASVLVHLGYAAEHRCAYLALVRGEHERTFPEVATLLDEARTAVADRLARSLNRERTPGLDMALHGYLSYVDAITVRWLEHPAELEPATLAALAAGALRGSLHDLDR